MILYAFGSNGSGQLGVGHEQDLSKATPCKGIPANEEIVKIVGGGNHSAVLTRTGHVYLAGSGQLGEKKQKEIEQHVAEWTEFREPEMLRGQCWCDVACGWAFTLLVSQSGQVYGFGTARFGELGPDAPADSGLTEIQGLQGIVSVACGWRHGVALDRHGLVYGWGWARHGQLGDQIGKTAKVGVQRLEEKMGTCAELACGHLHTILRNTEGAVIGFGSNKYGQVDEQSEVAKHISAGWHHSALLTPHNKLISWGRDDHHQLHVLENVTRFVCGSEHTLAQQENTVMAWGWNEHGNCGLDQDSTEAVQITLPQGRIVLLGAGCATSWVGIET
ncbi:hypothetical protein DFQ28_006837 [Apophysomyces sp. BC1034]|nr:hypothetical protein DFQ30_010996 [Apophysomyces sp. BC1015]KAG0178874.1 hypothetical protein DFQ29_002881 [Apophysomyces sp. BC1021]KAG0187121.1 hypothetical protein DFQ28_006837 [Apophysomyces sp. BC1034]